MRHFRRVLLLLCCAILTVHSPVAGQAKRAEARQPIRHVILISVDGLMPETYLDPDKHGLKVPTLREMARAGAVSDGAKSVFPTLTYPAHTSIATGTNPGPHGIAGNGTFDPENRNQGGWRWYAEDIRVPTLWDAARERGLRTALISWPVTVGARADVLLPEYWRAGTAEDVKLVKALSTPGLFEEVAARFPSFLENYSPPSVKDSALTDVAVHLLETRKPHLLLLHIFEVDHWQHEEGPWSPEAKAAIENADAQIARVITAAKKAGIWNRTGLVVVSDHGFAAFRQRLRLGVYLTQRAWVTLDERGRVTDWKAAVLPMHGLAYVYLKDPANEQLRREVCDLFESLARKPGSGIQRVYPPEEIRQLGGDPEAALAIGAAEGYDFTGGYAGDLVFPAGSAAGHGYDPRNPAMKASLLMYGRAVAAGTVANARLIDVAPTIARWLGLKLDKAEGKALSAAGASR
jgi:predicted AlkP superfamily pyrophosphatase or phosphodiesterase